MEDDHVGFCLRSLQPPKQDVEIPPVENFDFAEALESVYPLLEIVFSYLPYKDLKIASLVKPSWKELSDKILRKRNRPSWFTCYKKKKSNIVESSNNFSYNNVNLGVILYDNKRIKLNKFICVHGHTISRKTVPEYISDEVVPESVDYCLLSCPKVSSSFVGTNKDIKDIGRGSVFDGLFIPVIENIRIVMFHCNPLKTKKIQKTIELYIKPNEDVKCLLLFCLNDLHKSIYNLLDALLPENNFQSVAVGGGIIRGTKTFQQINPQKKVFSNNDTFCLAFLQEKYTEKHFDAFSVVITGDDLSKEEFECELNKFKSRIVLRSHTTGFRICCSAKYHTEDELLLFEKVFPNIPLLGLDADGEIGWNCFHVPQDDDNDYGDPKPKKAKQKYPNVQHQWSTVFVLITWGPLLK